MPFAKVLILRSTLSFDVVFANTILPVKSITSIVLTEPLFNSIVNNPVFGFGSYGWAFPDTSKKTGTVDYFKINNLYI